MNQERIESKKMQGNAERGMRLLKMMLCLSDGE